MIEEFDLDAPKLNKPCRLRFRHETRCVTSLFESYHQSTCKTEGAWKILVEVVEEFEAGGVQNLLGVITVQVHGEARLFFELDGDTKKRVALDYLMRGIQKVCDENSWDPTSFKDAESKILDSNFVNRRTWKKASINNRRDLSAEIIVEMEISKATVYAIFRDMTGEIVASRELVSDVPNEFLFGDYIGEMNWIDDESIELVGRDAGTRFVANAKR